jgi:hypothetical protein
MTIPVSRVTYTEKAALRLCDNVQLPEETRALTFFKDKCGITTQQQFTNARLL